MKSKNKWLTRFFELFALVQQKIMLTVDWDDDDYGWSDQSINPFISDQQERENESEKHFGQSATNVFYQLDWTSFHFSFSANQRQCRQCRHNRHFVQEIFSLIFSFSSFWPEDEEFDSRIIILNQRWSRDNRPIIIIVNKTLLRIHATNVVVFLLSQQSFTVTV